jgi:hypothetical protein
MVKSTTQKIGNEEFELSDNDYDLEDEVIIKEKSKKNNGKNSEKNSIKKINNMRKELLKDNNKIIEKNINLTEEMRIKLENYDYELKLIKENFNLNNLIEIKEKLHEFQNLFLEEYNILFGNIMLGIKNYLTNDPNDFINYILESKKLLKPIVSVSLKLDIREKFEKNLDEESLRDNFFNNIYFKTSIIRTRWWYFAITNINKKYKKIDSWLQLKELLLKIFNLKQSEKFKTIKINKKDGTSYNLTVFSDDFEKSVWYQIISHWINGGNFTNKKEINNINITNLYEIEDIEEEI